MQVDELSDGSYNFGSSTYPGSVKIHMERAQECELSQQTGMNGSTNECLAVSLAAEDDAAYGFGLTQEPTKVGTFGNSIRWKVYDASTGAEVPGSMGRFLADSTSGGYDPNVTIPAGGSVQFVGAFDFSGLQAPTDATWMPSSVSDLVAVAVGPDGTPLAAVPLSSDNAISRDEMESWDYRASNS